MVQVDRRGGHIRDESGVKMKFGVVPESIPDYLALVGDSADGYPGIRGWGPKSAAALMSRYGHLADVPLNDLDSRAAVTLRECWDQALLFRTLATLRTDARLFDSVDALKWAGPRPEAERVAATLGAASLLDRARKDAASVS